MTVAARFEDIAEGAESRPIDPQVLGRALLAFAQHGVLPREPGDLGLNPSPADAEAAEMLVMAAREATLDAEESVLLALGGDPDGAWLALVDACRNGGSVAADNALRAAMQGITTGRSQSVLAQLRAADSGRHEVVVA